MVKRLGTSSLGVVKYLAAALTAVLVLTACGGDAPPAGDAGSPDAESAATDEPDASDDSTVEQTGDPEETLEMTLVLPFGYLLSFSPELLAESAGYFDDHNLDVTVETAQGSSQAVQQVLGGQALVALTGAPDHIAAVAGQGAPLLSIGTVSQHSSFEMVSSAANPIESPAGLEGKTVGIVSPGGATEYLLNIMLSEAGLTMDDVSVEVVGLSPGNLALVESGDIDAFISTSGLRANLEYSGAELTYFSTHDFAPLPGTVYVVASDSAEENAEIFRRFLAGVQDSIEFMLDEDEGFEQTLELLGSWEIAALQDPERAAFELGVQSKEWRTDDGTILRHDPDEWEVAQDLMASIGAIDDPAPAEKLYTNEFMPN